MSRQQQRVLVTGGSGFIGRHLVRKLLNQEYQVIVLTRNKLSAANKLPATVRVISSLTELNDCNVDYVINLAGESIAGRRWSRRRKQTLLDSRIKTIQALQHWLEQTNSKPKKVLSASAIGYYGIDALDQWQVLDENAPPQPIFMSQLCQQWEQAASEITQLGVELIIFRLGVVLGKNGGALIPLLRPIKMNLFGAFGSGQQPFSWIHINDVTRAIIFLMQTETQNTKVFNLTAPQLITQAEFAEQAATKLKKIIPLRLPSSALRLVLGEQADLVTNGQFVVPAALQKNEFEFEFPHLKGALNNLLN